MLRAASSGPISPGLLYDDTSPHRNIALTMGKRESHRATQFWSKNATMALPPFPPPS